MRILKTSECGEWLTVLNRCSLHDFYHLPGYHAMAEARGEGTAYLFVYEEGDSLVALPLLLRPVHDVEGLEPLGAEWLDATSVYGYAGPVSSRRLGDSFRDRFQSALAGALRSLGVVSIFSRLHPLLQQTELLAGLGECVPEGRTVSIDLTLSLEAQWAKFRDNHLRDLVKLRQRGMECIVDEKWRYFDQFIDIYTATMRRVNASRYYFFDRWYFEELRANLVPDCHLVVVLSEGEVACGGFFVVCDGIVQYHLGGTADKYLRQAPMKLLVDEVRRWATARGDRVLHLGGGLGGREDALFNFKRGFSDSLHQFSVWRWVLNSPVYSALCAEKGRWFLENGWWQCECNYFPAYRSPAILARADRVG